MSAEHLLNVSDLTVGYDGIAVVRGASFSIRSGEVVPLLGPNGAGKTTILRAISGIIKPMRGAVQALGEEVARHSPSQVARRGVAHVAEGRSVFFSLTVAEHFRLNRPGQLLDRERIYEYLPALGELEHRRVGLLSGGEQQMLALGYALARRPRLLLVDELSLGLAPVIVERLLPVIRRYASDTGAAVLLVEQHVELALETADRAIGLSHGEIVFDRPTEQLRHDRALLVASYLGDQTTP